MASRFAEHGLTLQTPDFNQPDFAGLTISRMVGQVSGAIDALSTGPVVLIGSSLGAFVAVQAALARPDRVAKLVLLAPALDFGGNRMRQLGDTGIDEWRRSGSLTVFHYGFGRLMEVGYGLYEDAQRHDALNVTLAMPVQVFMGRQDDAVDPAVVEQWAQARPNVELHMLDDGHQLTASLDYIWREMERFLGLE